MNQDRIDQALSALGFALKEQQDQNPLNNPLAFVAKMPKRCLTGDHINGGTILKFKSSGITDSATKEQLLIEDGKVTVPSLVVSRIVGDLNVDGNVNANEVVSKTITADVLNVKEIKADIQFEKSTPIVFDSDRGIGMLWKSKDYTKQFVFNRNPDKFFSSESIDLGKGKKFSVNGITVLSDTELGATVTKSNLRTVGRLNGLIVDGSAIINDYLFYDSNTDRLGLGTDEPNGTLSIAEDGIELVFGTKDSTVGYFGTYGSNNLNIVTDNTPRILLSAGGDIQLGNPKNPPVRVSVHGKLAVKVANPDPEVDLHVNGAIKFNGKMHRYDKSYPTAGAYNPGDIVWNIDPKVKSYVGWVCVKAGSPGLWEPFGKIGN